MRIEKVEILPCHMPERDPEWRISVWARRISQGWLLRLVTDDGVEGCGYASVIPHMGPDGDDLKNLVEGYATGLVGRDPFDIEGILAGLEPGPRGSNLAVAAVDCALHEVASRTLGIPLHKYLGGGLRDEFPVMRVLSVKEPGEMSARAGALLAAGCRHIKIKVDGAVDADADRVRAIRDEVGADVRLIVDANQSYAPADAILFAERVEGEGIEIFEQPSRADDHVGLKHVTDNAPIPVEADESAASIEDVLALVSNRVVDLVSLKIPKLGGLRNAVAAARICEAGGVPCRMGAHVGPRLLSAQAMHVAAGLPGLSFACELGEFARLRNDITEGLEIENGVVRLSGAPGSGVRLRDDAQSQMSKAAAVMEDA